MCFCLFFIHILGMLDVKRKNKQKNYVYRVESYFIATSFYVFHSEFMYVKHFFP